MKYYNSGTALGVVGVIPGHASNEYTWLPSRNPCRTWVRTEDLFESKEEAEKAPVARFLKW